MNTELWEKLKNLASREAWTDFDDFDLQSRCGGNFDDAYWGGSQDGYTNLAREILKELGIE